MKDRLLKSNLVLLEKDKCVLYLNKQQSIDHLFFNFPWTIEVRRQVIQKLDYVLQTNSITSLSGTIKRSKCKGRWRVREVLIWL